MTKHPIRPERLAAFLATLIATIVVVGSLETASLPGLGSSGSDWFREVSPADGLLAVLRLVVLVGLAYLLLSTLLLLTSTILRASVVDRLAARFTGPSLQRFLRTSAGIGIGTVTSLQSLTAGAAPPPVTEPPDPVPAATVEPTAEEVTTLTRVDDPQVRPDEPNQTEAAPGEPESATVTTAPAEAGETSATDWWTVAPGDHLWHIAEETWLDQRGEAPSLQQTTAYWHVVCEANHGRLVDPGNPDLIMPGQQIALPPVPAGL